MNSTPPGNPWLEVKYDKDLDILYVLIPGRKIAASREVVSPLIIDFGSADDGFDVVGFELHTASRYLLPALQPADAAPLTVTDD